MREVVQKVKTGVILRHKTSKNMKSTKRNDKILLRAEPRRREDNIAYILSTPGFSPGGVRM